MDVLRRAAGRSSGSPALLDAEELRSWTFEELDRRADAVGRSLWLEGVGPDSVVVVRLPPSPEVVALTHAVGRVGATLLPLHSGWTEPETAAGVRSVTEGTGAHAVIVEGREEIAEWMEKGAGSRPNGPGTARAPSPADTMPEAPIVMLTSGSTGVPRPVTLTWRHLAASAEKVEERLNLRADDVWLASLSLAHIGGLALVHRCAWVGCRLITCRRFDPAEVARLLDRGRVTHLSLVPVMLRRLMAERRGAGAPSALRCVLLGGAAVPGALLEEALSLGYPIALTYGLTETTSQVATAPPDLVRQKPGTVGPPLSGLAVSIGPETGSEGEDGVRNGHRTSEGEIVVRGETVVVAEEALHTGDLGYLDGDGDLWITGRLSERIVTGGVTVEPGEIEAALSRYPGIRDIAVVGVPDEEWGERVVAVIVPIDASLPPTLEDLLLFSRERLSPPKRPRELRVADALPRTANGKLDRRSLRRA